jgi:hypothetical protein
MVRQSKTHGANFLKAANGSFGSSFLGITFGNGSTLIDAALGGNHLFHKSRNQFITHLQAPI